LAVEDRGRHPHRTFIGRSALLFETFVACAILAGCGGGSSGSSPSATPSAAPGNAVPVSVVITDDRLTANVSELSASKGAVLQIRNTSAQAAEVQIKANGQVIGNSTPAAGADTAVVIQRLQPGRLRLQAGTRSLTIKVAAPQPAPTEEGGDQQGNTADLRATVTGDGIRLSETSVPAFLKLDVELRNELPEEITLTLKAKGVNAVTTLPKGNVTIVPLDGLKPGRLRLLAAGLKASVKVRR